MKHTSLVSVPSPFRWCYQAVLPSPSADLEGSSSTGWAYRFVCPATPKESVRLTASILRGRLELSLAAQVFHADRLAHFHLVYHLFLSPPCYWKKQAGRWLLSAEAYLPLRILVETRYLLVWIFVVIVILWNRILCIIDWSCLLSLWCRHFLLRRLFLLLRNHGGNFALKRSVLHGWMFTRRWSQGREWTKEGRKTYARYKLDATSKGLSNYVPWREAAAASLSF